MAVPRRVGEPWSLSGSRLAFSNWHWIRPGEFVWMDAQGNNVTVSGSTPPVQASLVRRDTPEGIHLVVEPARTEGPVLRPQAPWERRGVTLSCVVQHHGRYVAWGHADVTSGTGKPALTPCYFTSTDGRHWNRPELTLVKDASSIHTNLLPSCPDTPFLDPAASPEQRFKGVILSEMGEDEFHAFQQERPDDWSPLAHRRDFGGIHCLRAMTSADGIHWRTDPNALSVEHSDTQIVATFDAPSGWYRIYTRAYSADPTADQFPADGTFRYWWGHLRRSVGMTESRTFHRFPVSRVLLDDVPGMRPDEVLYTNCYTTMPKAPETRLLFPSLWSSLDDRTRVMALASSDGRVWRPVGDTAVIRTGRTGQWDGGCVFARPNLFELPNGDFALPYTGYNVPHKYPRGRWRFATGYAIWPKGRLIGVHAPGKGAFTTVALMPPGRSLRLNARMAAGGWLLTELADLNGNPLPGYSFAEALPLKGDCYQTAPRWRNAQTSLDPGKPLILRFRLYRARLYWAEFV